MATIPPTTPKPLPTDPEALAARRLRGATIDELLTAAYSLTHRIHACERPRSSRMPIDVELAAQLRAQRDLVSAEIKGRCPR